MAEQSPAQAGPTVAQRAAATVRNPLTLTLLTLTFTTGLVDAVSYLGLGRHLDSLRLGGPSRQCSGASRQSGVTATAGCYSGPASTFWSRTWPRAIGFSSSGRRMSICHSCCVQAAAAMRTQEIGEVGEADRLLAATLDRLIGARGRERLDHCRVQAAVDVGFARAGRVRSPGRVKPPRLSLRPAV